MIRHIRLVLEFSPEDLEMIGNLPSFEQAVEQGDDTAIEQFNEGVEQLLKQIDIWDVLHDEVCKVWEIVPHPSPLEQLAETAEEAGE